MSILPSGVDGGEKQTRHLPTPLSSTTAQSAPFWLAREPLIVTLQRKSAVQRFLELFFAGLLVWFLIRGLVQSIPAWNVMRIHVDFQPIGPRPEDGRVIECYTHNSSWNSASNDGGRAYHSFYELNLRFDSETGYYFLNRGNSGTGVVHLVDDYVDKGSADLRVAIDVEYNDKDVFSQNRICLLERSGQRGIGIYSPDWTESSLASAIDQKMNFTVVYSIPVNLKAERTRVKSFETHTANFAHHIDLAEDGLFFERVALRGYDGAIIAETLAGTNVRLQTSGADITGRITSNGSVALETSNGDIETDVELTAEIGLSTLARQLILHTSNGRITGSAALKLHEANDSDHEKSRAVNSAFKVSARTANAPINYTILGLPVDSRLLLSAHTSNAPVHVLVGPTFEGDIRLHNSTSNAEESAHEPVVRVVGPVRDPKGEGRGHVLVRNNPENRSEWRGWVGWVDLKHPESKPAHWGRVDIGTSNGGCGLTVER